MYLVKRNSDYRAVILFLLSFTLSIIALTVSYYLSEIANLNSLSKSFDLAALLGMGLTVFTLPNLILNHIKSAYKKKLNMITAIVSALLCVLSVIFYFTNLAHLYYINFLVLISVFSLIVIYSMILLIKNNPPKKRKTHIIIKIIYIATFIFLPIFICTDILYDELLFIHVFIPRGFYTLPFFYLILSLFITSAALLETAPYAGDLHISQKFLNIYGISARENEILEKLISGKSYKEIGNELFISLPTAKTHVMNIYRKTDVNNKIELIKLILGSNPEKIQTDD